MRQLEEEFQSLETTLGLNDPRLLEGRDVAKDHIGRLGLDHFRDIANSPNADEKTGIQYVLVGSTALSEEGFSGSAITMDAPFGNGIWPHIVARAEMVAEMAYRGGLVDHGGNPIPVLLRAAPSADSQFGLSGPELSRVKKGDDRPIAEKQNDVAKRVGVNEIYGDVSFSLSSVHASARMVDAGSDMNIEGGVVLGEPPHAKRAMATERLISFGLEGLRFGRSLKDSGIDDLKQLMDSPEFLRGIWRNRKEYGAVVSDITRGLLERDMKALQNARVPAALLHASDSLIIRRKDALDAVARANEGQDSNFRTRRVEIAGANHSFGDLLGHFGVTAAGIVVANNALRQT